MHSYRLGVNFSNKFGAINFVDFFIQFEIHNLIFMKILFQIASSQLLKSIEWPKRIINKKTLQNIIEESIKCPFDLSFPFTNMNHLQSAAEREMNDGETRIVSYQLGDFQVSAEVLKIDGSVEILNEKLMKDGHTIGTYKKLRNGKTTKKIISDNALVNVIAYQDVLHMRFIVSDLPQKNVSCKISEHGDSILTVATLSRDWIMTSVLYKEGSWFNADQNNDRRRIIMGIHNFENNFDLSDESVNRYENQLTVESGLFTFQEPLFYINEDGSIDDAVGGYIGNYVKMQHKLNDGSVYVKIFINYGIIIFHHAILVNSYHQCEENPALIKWLYRKFQNITNNDSLVKSKNTGFLVYTTPEGETYRTSDYEIIKKFVNNEDYKMFDNCSMISYTGITHNGLLTLKKNYGIIKYGKLIRKSENLIDHRVAYEYIDDLIKIKWNKL